MIIGEEIYAIELQLQKVFDLPPQEELTVLNL